jgi:hypothetical protein
LRPDRVLGERLPGWLGPVARLGGVVLRGALRVATAGAGRGTAISDDVPLASELDHLAADVESEATWVGARGHEFHQWRFRDGPRFEYRVRYARADGQLVGYLAARVTDFEGVRACVIVDCVAAGPHARRVARVLLADTVRWAMTEHADLVAALSFGETRLTRSLRQFPLLRIPKRFSPQQAPVLAEWTGSAGESGAPDLALTLADLDVF